MFSKWSTFICCLSWSLCCAIWQHHVVLDPFGRYHLYWKVSGTTGIIFRVEVKTLGYVALGISPNGGMAGSDIVIGWVHNGRVFLQDRYAYKEGLPTLDSQQNWELLSGYENGSYTVLQFRRKLDTCDSQDFPITNNTARVIYAFHEKDPTSELFIPYHGVHHRGSKSIMLLQPFVERNHLPQNIKIWDIRSPNVTIPDDVDTTYWCKIVKAPPLNKKHHVIQVEPLIPLESSPYVHHMVLYRCLGASARELEPHVYHEGYQCYVPDTPLTYSKCESVYAAWGVGGLAMVMPENAGLPLGDKPNLYFLLEIHYDNTFLHSGVIDRSGFRIFYSPNLRRYDAMTLMVGASVDPCVVIPPGRRNFVVAGHADPQCLGPAIPPEGIRLFAVFLHSHLLGRQMKLRHFRNNVELPPIAVDENYDFNYQEYRYLPEEITVKSGDHLVVECTYDSTGRNITTFGGLGTAQEMCLAFILYYPRISRARAQSSATCDLVKALAGMEIKEPSAEEDSSNYTFYQHFYTNNPWDSHFAGIAETAMRFGYHRPQCYLGDGRRLKFTSLVTYPKNLRTYTEHSRCSSMAASQESWIEEEFFSPSKASSASSLPNFSIVVCLYLLLAMTQNYSKVN